ncbi:cohesin loading factor protein [Rutstroemia sp. NJR-2017a BBW]|nr:cohesin loading factor protein [Rutstroemia sp. NJR-2017a BBW]
MDGKAMRFLKEGLARINADTRSSKSPSARLSELVTKQQWRGQMLCYLNLYVAFCAAAVADWPLVKESMRSMTAAAEKFEVPLIGCLGKLALYLEGVYYQGSGDLKAALDVFANDAFRFADIPYSTSEQRVERDIALLAALNSLLILQDPQWQDPLEPYCSDHPNKDIQTAFSLIRATTKTSSAAMIHETKNHLAMALNRAKATANTQFLCLVLSIMCSKFFNNCVGDQAEKSALAARRHAELSKNKLWMSVSGGLLAQFYDISDKRAEAQATLSEACILAHEALPNL